jgi:hypothetical protein
MIEEDKKDCKKIQMAMAMALELFVSYSIMLQES